MLYRLLSLAAIVPFYANAAETLLPFSFSTHYEVYIVEGDTISDVEVSFDSDKPKFLKDKNADGYTGWEYDYWADDNTCEIKAFNLDITYKLPRIKQSVASPEISELYREYIEQLYRHEETHCALTVMTINHIYQAFKKGQEGNCTEQNHRVNKLTDRINEDNELFDTYTNHGEIELAVSPFGEEPFYPVCKIPFSGMMAGN
ncbi:DUF922 domain-containing protein [Photobacterium rosenbergii]|uniref:DUF922 domain-containing protein n=1 Tax=Photobacterium rosenbergii TaxID=294936 RepID=A0ABU3ZEW0_9GAMM|nr:DUF922 domain-containing protein [Photobacterium rosenbergii]MDV5168627.1 DUF922 domain-containing protein [Photobacterium rosenbergii]